MLKIGFCLSDHEWNRFHALAQAWNPFFRWREIPCNQQIKAVGQALHVNQRIPLRFLQLFSLENLVIDVLLQDAKIDIVGAREARSVESI